ncbi:MAG: rod shape-determining protein MreC [Candidatus Magasanikbacteria bacterium RIFCSPLOWO2_12_FULL_47_9b]|nr:MAG: rod shape-determining protein MreC [Candidatus Magasanikbacteria bacterium RIFCSPLOWO2_02_FULL_47_16]OGH80011.1 MAG: rod shape-determining protein MreC [Candidatus Magasanikbacteria bacterium RIFCSPHIGHO2_02_FULL_48_18]OGH82921.1 MAG: rod shape-determining protein MreC [Candidatus Magasanikbacteria bacterium RIFCSPLOWO2_12_FULL_47_9b]
MRSRARSLFGISTVILTVIFFHYFGFLYQVEEFFRRVIGFGSGKIYALTSSVESAPESFDTVDACVASLSNCRTLSEQMEIDRAAFELLQEENVNLRNQLHFIAERGFITVGADVIGKNSDPVGNILILNRGSNDGIFAGAPAIVGGGLLVGKVVQADPHTSLLQLANDNRSRFAATILNRERSIGLVEGGYGISVEMNFIPQNETVNIGDQIITSGLETPMPRGLIIGRVESVEKEPYQPFQRAVLHPAADMDAIAQVSVIIGY